MEGYYGRERHQVFTPDGWFRTGDVFATDADGFFYFKGRLGDMIKTGGANVSPRRGRSRRARRHGLRAGHRARPAGPRARPDRRRRRPGHYYLYDDAIVIVLSCPPLVVQGAACCIVHLTPEALPVLSSGKPDMRALMELCDGH